MEKGQSELHFALNNWSAVITGGNERCFDAKMRVSIFQYCILLRLFRAFALTAARDDGAPNLILQKNAFINGERIADDDETDVFHIFV